MPPPVPVPESKGLFRHHIPRPRLTRLLDAAEGQAVIVAAPAGFGKTTLVAEWARGRTVAWYDAGGGESDVVAFAAGLAAAVGAVCADAAAAAEPAPTDAQTTGRGLAERLAQRLGAWPEDAWIVIDDYHAAEGPSVDEFLESLLALAPVRLLVAARRRPAWVSARQVLYGAVTELGRDDLVMTAEEARRVLGEAGGEDVEALLEQAEGWPAVIGLAALSAPFARPEARMAEALYRYFAEEVLSRQPADVRRFMLVSAVPTRVAAEFAAATLGADRTAEIGARLAEEGVLHEARPEGLRFHPLLRSFLREKLRDEDPALFAAAYARAIDDACRQGRWEDAFELAVECHDADAAGRVTAEAAGVLLDAGRLETVERWLEVCATEGSEHPGLELARGEVLIRRGRLHEASALVHTLAEALAEDDPHVSAAWYLAGRSHHLLSEDEDALVCHLRAADTATTARDSTNALWGAAVVAAQLEQPTVMDDVVARLERLAADGLDARLQLASARVFLGSRRGTLAGIWEAIEPLAGAEAGSSDAMARNSFLIAAAYLNVARADYRLALELAERAIAQCDEFGLGRLKSAFCLSHRAAAEIGLRRFVQAERTFDEIARLGIEHTDVLVAEQRILRVKLALATGEPKPDLDASASAGTPSTEGELAGLLALAAAARGEEELSRQRAQRAISLTGSIEARFYADFADVVLELVVAGPSEALRAQAAAALSAAQDAALLDAFVVAYRACPPLLALLRDDPRVARLAAGANDLSLARHAGVALARGAVNGHPHALLTPREREVLELIVQGLGNAEIARRLYISEKTAKVHATHIFRKLGVSSRVQAVIAAQRLAAAGD